MALVSPYWRVTSRAAAAETSLEHPIPIEARQSPRFRERLVVIAVKSGGRRWLRARVLGIPDFAGYTDGVNDPPSQRDPNSLSVEKFVHGWQAAGDAPSQCE